MDSIYPSDILNYQEIITKRRYGDYLMQLAIIHNPNSDNPQELFDNLQQLAGESYIDAVEPDREGIKSLQGLLSPQMQK